MLDVSVTNCKSTGELLDRALDTVEYYGFQPLENLLKERKPARRVAAHGSPSVVLPAERKLVGVTKRLVSHGFTRHSNPRFVYQLEHSAKTAALGLHAVASSSAIAEGTLIAALATLIKESGMPPAVVHINSMGDTESAQRFLRELTAYLRRSVNDMPQYARDELRAGNPAKALTRLKEKAHPLADSAPTPMEFLNDESRVHLRQVLEYVESVGITYELDGSLVGSSDCWQHTLFELRVPDAEGNRVTVAHGGRHNTLAQKSFRIDLPVVSAVIEHDIRGRAKPKRRARTVPKVFFAQLGPEAKMKSFTMLERLRTAGIPVAQHIALESIGSQLTLAESAAVPYTIIVGHKEALEDTAIVRDMRSRSQVVVPAAQVPGYLKRLRAV